MAQFSSVWFEPDRIYFKEFSIPPPVTDSSEDIIEAEIVEEQQELTEAIDTIRDSLHAEIIELFTKLSQTRQIQGNQTENPHPERGLYIGEDEEDLKEEIGNHNGQ